MTRESDRKEPEAFLDLVPRANKGRLKIYIGAAAGVGKTWRMLEEAHELRANGVDVVIGFVETHNRAETVAKVGNLEVVARKKVEYRGVTVEEMDLDAVLARKPDVAVVDELAHTNAVGSRHERRYQDVEELLVAGVNVITALNVQHVESLNVLMRRVTGIDVRETVPDSFLAHADQIVNVDVSVEALRERLREGKIYPPAQIEHALKNFFKPSNLASLREIALREIAKGLSRQREEHEVIRREGGRRPIVNERIMVGLSSNSNGADKLLRRASRMAGQLNADWYAVHIETPAESVKKIGTREFVALLDNINLAGDLGAETVWLKGNDVVRAMIDFGREKNVSKIVVGRSHRGALRTLLGQNVPIRLLREGADFDIEVVSEEDE